MNVLLYEWNTFGQNDLEDTLIMLGFKVDKIKYTFNDFERDEVFEDKLKELFLNKKYDFVISFNYFQVISRVCNRFCIKYIAWVWDSPLLNLNSVTIHYPINYIFIFDYYLYNQLKNELGANTVYYLPLAVNVERLDRLEINQEDKERYSADLSFVGSLYDKRNHFDEVTNLPDYLKGYFDGIIRSQMRIYGYNFIKEMLTDEIIKELEKYISIRPGQYFIGDIKDILADRFLNSKITGLERRELLQKLSEHVDVTLYTDSDSTDLYRVKNRGYIDYYHEMPNIFRLSKINLNITTRTIKTGIPLRVFDILGAGGFLITNYQADIENYFEIGKDLVVFESAEDLIEKVKYYLVHEEERRKIAKNGYNKVKQYHNYLVRLEEILQTVIDGPDSTDVTLCDKNCYENPDQYIVRLKQQMKELHKQGQIEGAKELYFSTIRQYNQKLLPLQILDFSIIYSIYSWEKQRGQYTIFDYSSDLDQVWDHYTTIKKYLLALKITEQDSGQELINYTIKNQVSYTTLEFIIEQYVTDKLRLLNKIAMLFLEADLKHMVLPFLFQAMDRNPEDEDTLYHLAYVLNDLGEYDFAYEYIEQVSNKSSDVLKLLSTIRKNLSSIND